MMELRELTGTPAAAHILEKHFSIHPKIPVLIHEGLADGERICYTATEDYGLALGPHIYVLPEKRNLSGAHKCRDLFQELYIPMAKDRGAIVLSTNCPADHKGMNTLIKLFGFETKNLTVAELAL